MSATAIAAAALVLSAAVPMSVAQSGSSAAADVDVVQGTQDGHSRMTVPVNFAGRGPFEFLIDTGAQNTVLSRNTAARLALAPTAQARLIGIAGSEMVDTVHVEQIDLGRRSYYGLLSPLLDAANIGADGIVGLDSLQGQRVLIDFKRNLMAIGDARELGGNSGFEIVVTARRRSGQLIMTDALIDGVRTDVVIDTGAENSIGNLALQRRLEHRPGGDKTSLRSVTGQEISATMGSGAALQIGKVQINNIAIAYADAPPFQHLGLDQRPALLLGMRELRSFKRVAIDFSTRKILFDVPFNTMMAEGDWATRGNFAN